MVSESENGDGKRRRSLLDEIRAARVDADKGREPELLSSRMGTRSYSVAALVERIEDAFIAEHAGGSDALREADTETKRLKLVLATTDYIFAVESVQVSDEDKAAIIRRVYNELFTYGPLDDYLHDESVTTITVEGADKAFVRRGHGELESIGLIFEDQGHVRRIVHRLLLDSGAVLTEDMPIIEAGLRVGKRPVCINVAGPPVTILLSVDIRVHPAEPIPLEKIVQDEKTRHLLRSIAASEHGFIIVGDTESGKTTLLSAMAHRIMGDAIAVERAGEMHLPGNIQRLVVQWPMQDREPITFAQQVQLALQDAPGTLLLDEIRADEAHAIYFLLANELVPRQIWSVRGPSDSKRLISALGMVARRSIPEDADHSDGEMLVRRMYERLPFVITLRRRKNELQLYSISEWQFAENADYPDFVELMAMGWEGIEPTGKRPLHTLDLPSDFWG